MVKGGTLPLIKYYLVYCHQFHGIHAFSSSYSSVSVISYSYNLGDFVEDFYELSMILNYMNYNYNYSYQLIIITVMKESVSLLYLAFEYLTRLLTLDGVH